MMLDASGVEAFARDGFLVIRDAVPADDRARLRRRIAEIVAAMRPEELGPVFRTDDQSHARDRYFLESADRVSCFLEPEAVDAAGRLRVPVDRAINKIGHALHDLDPDFGAFSRRRGIEALAKALGLTQPLLLQSMIIFKQPQIGGEVGCHQDSTFLHTEPESCLGLWFALEDADRANGCLQAEPGGHRRPLHARFRRDGLRTWMDVLDPAPLPSEGLVPLEARAGDLILLHGRLPHRSGANRTARSRQAYTLHLIDGACRYSPDNWLRRASGTPPPGSG